ncbi:hypothetical protein DFH06DRAFT_155490 [Mycena polygramma]|nr:hypothetical protein DFH06DRAFT_155490 [Mycena polygramma]
MHDGGQHALSPVPLFLAPAYASDSLLLVPFLCPWGSPHQRLATSARVVFFRFYPKLSHRCTNTVRGCLTIMEVIPFFLMSSLFDGWFGFTSWAMAHLILYPLSERWTSKGR